MGGPTSWARINFPVKMIDAEIQEFLEKNYRVIFKEGNPPTSHYSDLEIEVVDGIFGMHDSDVNDGEFVELELKLVEKGVPFDRETGMDWEIPPRKRIFRPAEFDHVIYLNDEGDEVVTVAAIRERLTAEEEGGDVGLIAYKKLIGLMTFLDKEFPTYPPLADYVKIQEGDRA